MHHRELGRKKDVKGIMIRADHIIQSRQPPSPSLSLSFHLRGNLQIQLGIMQCVNPSGLGLFCVWGSTAGRYLLNMNKHGNTRSCINTTRMAGFLQHGDGNK